MQAMMDRKQAAEYLGVAPGTLANWQCSKFRRIPHVKIGRAVKYRLTDLERWIESNVVDAIEATS